VTIKFPVEEKKPQGNVKKLRPVNGDHFAIINEREGYQVKRI